MKSIYYSEDKKREVVAEYRLGKTSLRALSLKHGIMGSGTITKWLILFPDPNAEDISEIPEMNAHANCTKQEVLNKVSELEEEIIRLNAELAETTKRNSRLQDKVLCFETLIQIAGKKYGVDIKKNFGQ